MSDPGAPAPAVEEAVPSLIEQPGEIPETVTPPEDTPAEEPEAPAAEAAPEAPKEPEKPKIKPWFQTRIDELTRQKHEERRKNEELAAQLAALKAPTDGQPAAPRAEDFDKAVDARARALVEQKEAQTRSQAFLQAGNKDFGADDFTEKCNIVASLGAGDSPEFMKIITDPDIIPDGHKIVAALADQPEEAHRILSLEPVKMAAALTRFASQTPKPDKPLSQAPKPITPIGGSAKSSGLSDTMDTRAWMAERNKTAWDRKPKH
jgi:hypothetical protein